MKISFIATVFNEEDTVSLLLDSLLLQSVKPDEVIIVDGGSSDNTVKQVQEHKQKCKVIVKKGNRAVGRNAAITTATGNIILCSDAGCILDRDWVKSIVAPFKGAKTDVVAGYYKGKAKNIFQRCLVPYALVMPDKVDPETFLPASRSMAFRKSIWEKVGGFPESFSYNEDYIFAKKLKKINANIVFARDALVYWMPRKNLGEAASMFYRFAQGDMEAGIVRPKVILLFARYLVGLVLLTLSFVTRSDQLIVSCYLLIVAYLLWSIAKNYKYVNDPQAIFFLPAIQLTADFAVLLGSLRGIIMQKQRI